MKRAVAAVAVVLAGSLMADSVDPIGWRQTGGVNVGEGTESLSQPLQIGSKGTFVKTGAGTLNVPVAALDTGSGTEHVVVNGTLNLTGDAVAEPAFAVPACCAQAASWFSAMDTSYITVDGNAYVQNWYDVRETGVTGDGFAPTRPFMKHMMGDAFLSNADDPAAQQTVATYLGCNAVYFGGLAATTKGGFMGLVTADGATDLNHERVYQAFIVHGVKDGLGSLLGSYGNPDDFFNGGGLTSVGKTGYYYFRGDTMPGAQTARHYLNGEVFDPFYAMVKARVELVSADFVDRPTRFATFFNQRGRSCASGRYGGDYLSEVIVFTNRLTETEIVEVNRYLMRKWNIKAETGANPTVGIAANGSVEAVPLVDASVAAEYTNYYPVTFIGEGSFAKAGSGRMAIGPKSFAEFNGAFSLFEGSVHSRFADFPPIVPVAGKTYNATTQRGSHYDLNNGEVISVSNGSAGKVTKTGDDDLSVGDIPDGVETLDVRQGKVRFAGRDALATYAVSSGIRGVFADPGVENEQVEPDASDTAYRRKQLSRGGTVGGWTRPSTGTANSGIVIGPALSCAEKYWYYEIPEGRQAIYLFNPATDSSKKSEIYTTVTFPAAGDYLVSWRETRAWNIGKTDYAFTYHVLFGTTWETASEVDHRICADGHYPRVYMKLHVADAGTYVFGFRVDATEEEYYSISMDDFRADGIARDADAGVVKIPNGDFEQVYIDGNPDRLAAKRNGKDLTIRNRATGWTFYQGDGWTDGTPPMIAVTGSMVPVQDTELGSRVQTVSANTANPRFSRTADATSFGKFQLFMANNADYAVNNHADTTFTVAEPGRYYLRAKASRWNHSYTTGTDYLSKVPAFAAKVTIGGEETALGTLVGDQLVQTDRFWPKAFTVTEANQTVTLVISQTTAKSGGLLDDLVLVKADVADRGIEYIANGSFEDCTKKTSYVDAGTMKAWGTGVVTSGDSAGVTFYAGNAYMDSTSQQYVDTPIDGDIACSIRGDGYIWQTLPEMEAGRYRFRFAANTRRGSWQGYGGNGVRAELLDGSDAVVQEICNVDSVTNFDQRVREFVFDLKTSGTYKLRVVGTKTGKQGSIPATLACVVDGLSLKRVVDGMRTPPSVPEDLVLDVAAGATVDLDFDGSIKVEKVKYAGKVYRGTLTAANCPALTGAGVIETSPKVGSVIIFR